MAVALWTVPPLVLLHLWFWRRRHLLRFQLLLDLVLLAVMAPALSRGFDLNPVRLLETTPPFTSWKWSEATQLQPTQSDLVLQFHPWWAAARDQLAEGRLPLIAPLIGGGVPLLANGQIGLWAPVMAPVWVLGPERGTTVMALWKIELAGLGTYLLLASLGLPRRAAVIGGLTYGGCPYLVGWLLVPLAWVAAALPWIWWLMVAALRRRASWRLVAGAGAAGGWLLGAGLHPETAVVVLTSAGLAGLVLHPRRWTRVVAVGVVAGVVGVVLAWPTARYIPATAKYAGYRQEAPNRHGLDAGVRLAALQQLVIPAVHGYPGRGDWNGPYPYPAAAAGVGGAALALLLVGATRRRRCRLLLAVTPSLVLAAVLAYRAPPLDWLMVRVPPFDRMTLPRFAVLAPWALAILAALSVEGLLRGRVRAWPWRLAAGILPVAALLASGPLTLTRADVVLVALSVLLAAAVALHPLAARRWIELAVAGELALLALGVNPAAAPRDRLPDPPVLRELQGLVRHEGGRIVGLGGVLPPNLASRYGIGDLRDFDPLRPTPLAHLLGALGEPEPILGGNLEEAPARLCGAWSVRFLVARLGSRPPGWEAVVVRDGLGVWRNPFWQPEVRMVGRSFAVSEPDGWELLASDPDWLEHAIVLPPGPFEAHAERMSVQVHERRPDRVVATTRCDGPCVLVLAQPWSPGWSAKVDGQATALVRANLAGLGVPCSAGSHRVDLSYWPW